MTTTNIVTPCDVCGEPATCAARDMKEVSEPTDTIERYEPGDAKYGCDKHPVSSTTYKRDGIVEDLDGIS